MKIQNTCRIVVTSQLSDFASQKSDNHSATTLCLQQAYLKPDHLNAVVLKKTPSLPQPEKNPPVLSLRVHIVQKSE